MHQPITSLRNSRQPPRTNIELQRIMNKSRLSKLCVPRPAPLYEFRLGRPGLEVLICGFLLRYRGVRDRFGSVARWPGWVVMAGVDSVGWWEGEEFLHRCVQLVGVSAGKVTAC